ncbi:MAG: hypothetical protein IJU31_06875 [Synergistaceae bacterium]|nr:hypothetical protein [Synergistaceae bacterium]
MKMISIRFSAAELRRIDRITDRRLRAYELRKLIWRAVEPSVSSQQQG